MTYLSNGAPQTFGAASTMTSPRISQPGVAQPTTEAMRQRAAASIQRCYRWMEAAVPLAPQVAVLAPVLVTAVQQYAAQQYLPCLQQVAVVAQVAQQLQAQAPGLPLL